MKLAHNVKYKNVFLTVDIGPYRLMPSKLLSFVHETMTIFMMEIFGVVPKFQG